MNPFEVGQKVLCVSDDFRVVITTGEDKSVIGNKSIVCPIIGQTYIVDEILGEYLNFTQFNFPGETMWFHYKRFAPIEEKPINYENIEFVSMPIIPISHKSIRCKETSI